MIQDLRQTQEYAQYMRQIGWQSEKIFNSQFSISNYIYIKKLPLLPFSVAKLQRPVGPIDWKEVEKVKKKYRIIKLITEETVAKRTIWIDLRKSEKQLLKEMKPKTRYNIGFAQRQRKKLIIKIIDGSVLSKSDFVLEFLKLLRENAKRLRIFGMPQKWFEAQVSAFGNKCFAVLASAKGRLVAGNFFMVSADGCFYSHNGSVDTGRKLMAPTLCVWEGIKEAKRRKLKIFDFDGIYDGSRVLRRWQGFTRFKRGFGGEEITFS